ncbi:MAG: insulinase family protein [Alphaproteobacteria bacterium]|nr:insulinase family protein [Alphaproteobacteria bacterium]
MQPEITVLKNGLRVASFYYPQFETVSLGIWVNTGSAYEPENLNGISHFVEHMVFKGTKSRNAFQISEDIENVGGRSNAYTSREFTAFYAKMLKNDAELALDVLSEMMTCPSFLEEELIKEREVVVQEIKQTFDDPSDIIFDYMQAQAYQNQAMGRPILGTPELVRSFGSKELRAYMNSNYAANNMVVCAVGNIKHDDFVKMVENKMSLVPQHSSFSIDKQKYYGGYFAEKRDNEQAQIILGFDGFKYADEHYYSSMLLTSILGGGMSSRLFKEIREKRGLVYSVYCFPNYYTGSGFTGISAATDREQINEMMPVMIDEIKKMTNEKVSAEELVRAKSQMKAGMLMSLENSSAVAEKLARQLLLFNRYMLVDEMVEYIEAVTADDILKTAQKIFATKPTYTLVGNIDNHISYEEVQNLIKG